MLDKYIVGVRQVRNEVCPNVSHQTVWRVAKSSPFLLRQRLKPAPHLTEAHKIARIRFAEARITWTREWSTVSHIVVYVDEFVVDLGNIF